ncbi:hypothetical protein COV88_03870 [Candidatus Saccharibacteria bacterium CG11_big_fil_rev_8_21_14_0_20_41_19]|nr:MAG: hypothetical protein COV88_03870 [Candidatus Saccharibacteria bacterium CG11_big_fil_rev_8_21_14_0_20_41_19]PJE66345.1 MAG: hypothetical protein COU92_00850 [Candidatus Saccharibacteria bacterium CG10_big_fil_rev_8_21_14_0_10_41_32]
MKTIIIKSLKDLIADRYLLALLSVLLLLALTFAVVIGLSIHPSERQLISHYSAFGITHFYFDQWFYMLSFVIFGIAAAVMHIVVAIKLLLIKGHSIAVMYAWFGIAVILLAWKTASTLLNLRTLL